jgi:hypothetical protein
LDKLKADYAAQRAELRWHGYSGQQRALVEEVRSTFDCRYIGLGSDAIQEWAKDHELQCIELGFGVEEAVEWLRREGYTVPRRGYSARR